MRIFFFKAVCAAVAIVTASTALAQDEEDEYFMGLLIDREAYSAIPAKPRLLTRDYTTLPESASVKQYAPTPRHQGRHGTCASWSTTYAARTIAEAVANGWTDQEKIDSEAFAPIFVYQQTKESDDPGCRRGTFVHKSFKLLKEKGVPKLSDLDELCADSIPDSLFIKAQANMLDDFFTLFLDRATDETKILTTKKALSQNCPVVICMQVPKSFIRSKRTDVWNKTEETVDGGWHGMCVVGYDDNKYGGAFQLMNSWGLTWGDGGYIWVRYKDFADHVAYAYEPYVAAKEGAPEPDALPSSDTVPATPPAHKFAGSLRFVLSTGDEMSPTREDGRYTMSQGYISGTRYRIYLSNNEPAWIYVLGSDATDNVSMVFPPDSLTSPALVYSSNDIALPDENWFIEMDEIRGTDNICVLYSKTELPIKDIISDIEKAKGTFRQRVGKALGSKAIGMSEVMWDPSAISFSGATDASVVPVFVDIPHL